MQSLNSFLILVFIPLFEFVIYPVTERFTEPRLPTYALLFVTLRASEAGAQCIVIGPVCGFVCVFVGLLPR